MNSIRNIIGNYQIKIEYKIILLFLIFKMALHLFTPEYGFHRDELYFIAIGDSYSLGNLDALPFAPLYYRLFTFIFGYSIKVLHAASAICSSLTLVFACLITKELGGKKYAIALSGLLNLFSGFLVFGSLATYESPNLLIWVLIIYFIVRLIKSNEKKNWVYIGLLFGFGLITKLTIVFLGFGILIGFLVTPQRKLLVGKEIWIGAFIAFLFSIPYIIWQFSNHWYFLKFASGYSGSMNQASILTFIWNQIFTMNLFSLPVWMTGLIVLLTKSNWKNYRSMAVSYLVLFVIFFYMHAPFYFLIPFYALFIAVGAIEIEKYVLKNTESSFAVKLASRIYIPVYVLFSLPTLPLILPILPVDTLTNILSKVGVDAGIKTTGNAQGNLPQHIADKFGWEEITSEIAEAHKFAQGKYGTTGIMTVNWGEASAVHLFGKKYNLPEPISYDGWFYFEALRTHNFTNSYVVFGYNPRVLQKMFANVDVVKKHFNAFGVPQESNQFICICTKPRFDLRKHWFVKNNMDEKFNDLINQKKVMEAIKYFKESKLKDPTVYFFTEDQINSLAYRFLEMKCFNEAIELFKLNNEVFPFSFNTFDSLAEGYFEKGDYKLALENFEKSLKMNPDNKNAVKKIQEIKSLNKI